MDAASLHFGIRNARQVRPAARLVVLNEARQKEVLPSPEELTSLIDAVAREQDRNAFARLFGYFAPRVKGFLMRSGLADSAAEEVTQDARIEIGRLSPYRDHHRPAGTEPPSGSVGQRYMTINHHPSDETLMRMATGTLSAGPALVVSVHLEGCAVCRNRMANFEAIGGAILDEMPPVPLAADLFGRTMERLEFVQPSRAKDRTTIKHPELGIELPRGMRDCEIGPWKWLGPGFKWSKVRIAGSPDAKVMLLKGKAGLHLPAHGHTGLEFMQILSGSLSDQRGQYFPGDLDEAGDDVDHRPVVGQESDCICLAALEGDTRLHGFLGRLLRPIVGF